MRPKLDLKLCPCWKHDIIHERKEELAFWGVFQKQIHGQSWRRKAGEFFRESHQGWQCVHLSVTENYESVRMKLRLFVCGWERCYDLGQVTWLLCTSASPSWINTSPLSSSTGRRWVGSVRSLASAHRTETDWVFVWVLGGEHRGWLHPSPHLHSVEFSLFLSALQPPHWQPCPE